MLWTSAHASTFVALLSLSAAGELLAPSITVEEATSEDEEQFTVSEVSEASLSDAELPDTEQLEPQTSDHQTASPTHDQLLAVPDGKTKVSQALSVPDTRAKDKAEEEVIKKGGMAGAIARTFVVCTGGIVTVHFLVNLHAVMSSIDLRRCSRWRLSLSRSVCHRVRLLCTSGAGNNQFHATTCV